MRKAQVLVVAICLSLLLTAGVAKAGTGYSTLASLTITGRGRAHGVGLCMASVKQMAKNGWTYPNILRYFYRSTRVLYKTNIPQAVRVGVYRTSGSITVAGGIGSSFTVRTASGRYIWAGGSGRALTVSYSPSTHLYSVVMRRNGTVIGSKRTSSVVRVVPRSGTILKIVNTGKLYRGTIEPRWGASSGRMWAVNIVSIELYIRGLGEEPDSWPREGLRTLMVVSRSYAADKVSHPKHSGDGFAICNTGDCQAYEGYNYERYAPNQVRAAVATAHRVVTYGGALVVTPYFSNSGGQTENIEYVWGGSAKPWLVSVKTPYASWHEAYSWTVPLSFKSLAIRLARSSATRLSGTLAGFRILSTGVSPRIRTMQIVGSTGTKTVTGSQVQSVVNLQSTWFRFDMPPRLSGVRTTPSTFSPNGDGAYDTTRLYFTPSELVDNVGYTVRRNGFSGTVVDTWSSSTDRAGGRSWYLTWDGKSSSGARLADGRYYFLLWVWDVRHNRNYAGAYVTINTLLGFVSATPTTIVPGGDAADDTSTISFTLARAATVNVTIEASGGAFVKTLAGGSMTAGTHNAIWDGRDSLGAPVPDGSYTYTVSASDGSFNAARSGTITVVSP